MPERDSNLCNLGLKRNFTSVNILALAIFIRFQPKSIGFAVHNSYSTSDLKQNGKNIFIDPGGRSDSDSEEECGGELRAFSTSGANFSPGEYENDRD